MMQYLALIIAIVGGLIYVICTWRGEMAAVGELGRIAFAVGLLAWLLKGV